MQFDFSKYTGEWDAMYIETKEEQDVFSECLNAAGRKWCSHSSYLDFKPSLPKYYFFNQGMQSSHPDNRYAVLKCKDFMYPRSEF